MGIEVFKNALETLRGWPTTIGIIGGEPVLHPKFEELCLALRDFKKTESNRIGLWTSGGKGFEKNKKLIDEVFDFLAYNKHTEYQKKTCLHQPITISISDVVKDENYKKKLIDECWVQRMWCPSIGIKGCFFCEIACALDKLLDGPGGWKTERGWWKKEPKDFQDQVERYFKYCGMPVPLKRELLSIKRDKISSGLLKIFKEHNLRNLNDQNIEVFDKELTIEELGEIKKEWDPGNYRGDLRSDMSDGWEKRSG